MNKKILAALSAAVISIGTIGASASMMADTTTTTSKLVALNTDGTVISQGYNFFDTSVVSGLSGIKQIACEDFKENIFFYLTESGAVGSVSKYNRSEYNALSSWENITYIDAGNDVVFGITADKTLKICGTNASYYRAAQNWTDIAWIYAKEDAVLGITESGTVVATGLRANDSRVKSWTGIKKAVFDGTNFWGINESGDIVTTESKFKASNIKKGAELLGDFKEIECMTGYSTAGAYSRLLALKNDGTLVDITNFNSAYGTYEATVLYNDVAYVSAGAEHYVIVLKDGEIVSDRMVPPAVVLGIDIRVNGKYVDSDVDPYIKNDRTMVPVRAIAEALGAQVAYDDAAKTATISRNGDEVKITMYADSAFVNGDEIALDAAAETVNSRIFVPVRFVSEGLKCSVNWNAETKSVIITD